MLSDRGLAFLEARNLTAETAIRFEIYTTSRPDGDAEPTLDDSAQYLAIPYFEGGQRVAVRFRDMREDCPHEDRYRSTKGDKPRIFNRDVIAEDVGLLDQPLIVTEGELDAMAAYQAGYQRVIGFPGAKLASLVDEKPSDFAEVDTVVLATDTDEDGQSLRLALAAKLGEAKCKYVKSYPVGCKDLGDALKAYGDKGVRASIDRAEWVPISGLYKPSEIPPRPPLEVVKVNSFGAEFFKHIGICKRQLSLWTGEPGGGKSTIIKALMWALTKQHGWKHAGGFFEDDAASHTIPDLMRLHMGRELEDSPLADEARAWVEDNFFLIAPESDEPPTVEWFIQRAEAAVRRHGVQFVLVDPWSEFDLRLDGRVPETEKIRKYLISLRHFARRFNVHVAVIAHPRKHNEWGGTKKMAEGNDIAGSLHFKARCDLGVTVQTDPVCKGLSNIKVWKSRRWKEMGEPGDFTLTFHAMSGRFSPITAEAAAMARGDDPKVIEMKTRKPVASSEEEVA